MSDHDLIRRGDALYAIAGWEIPSTAIAAMPAVKVGVNGSAIHRAVRDWIRDDAGAAVKMSVTPDQANALTERILAALEPVTQPTTLKHIGTGLYETQSDYRLAPHLQSIVEAAKTAPKWDTVNDRMASQPAPDADNSYPYDAIEQCERDLDGVDEAPVVNDKLRTMHQEYLQAIADGRLVTDAVSPTDARLRAATAQLDAGDVKEAWEKAYWRMRSYAVHDNDCKLNKPPRFDGPCSCGLTAALEEALALLTEKPHDRA